MAKLVKKSTLRIIGGKWRRRKIDFIPAEGLRPTTDTARETLFNWLANDIIGTNCLDLFAGTGLLSLEAISRGAHHVVATDISKYTLDILRKNLAILQTDCVDLFLARIPEQLYRIPKQQFDLVFIDPPFNLGLIKPTCNGLNLSGYLKDTALIYLECEKSLNIDDNIPSTWQIIRKKSSRLTQNYLCQNKIG